MTPYPPWGSISITFMIIGSYLLIIGLDSAAFYLATDSALRRIVATSPQREYDFLKSLGYTCSTKRKYSMKKIYYCDSNKSYTYKKTELLS